MRGLAAGKNFGLGPPFCRTSCEGIGFTNYKRAAESLPSIKGQSVKLCFGGVRDIEEEEEWKSIKKIDRMKADGQAKRAA
jgi:hypothetical protein